MNIDVLVITIATIILIFAVKRFMGIFFENRKTSPILLILSYLPIVVTAFIFDLLAVLGRPVFFFGSRMAMLVIIFILGSFIITLNYESTLIRKVVAAFYVFVTRDISIALINNFFLIMIPRSDYISYYAALMFSGNMTFLVVTLFYSRFKHIKKDSIYTSNFWGLAMFIAISIIAIGLFRSFGFPRLSLYYSIVIIFAGSHFLVFYLSNKIAESHEVSLKATLHSKEKEYYSSQCQLMQESAEQVKSMRHDMKLHLATVMDFIESGNTNEGRDYLKSLLGNFDRGEVYSDTGNIAVDSIINYKLKTAVEDNIKTEIHVFVPTVLSIEDMDIVAILGNLLDNALEGVGKIEDEGREIKLNIATNKGNLLIKIENTFDGVVEYGCTKKSRWKSNVLQIGDSQGGNGEAEDGIADKDNAKKVITTRKEGDWHGYGLKNILRSVEKYNGHMDVSYQGNVFTVGILLYVK